MSGDATRARPPPLARRLPGLAARRAALRLALAAAALALYDSCDWMLLRRGLASAIGAALEVLGRVVATSDAGGQVWVVVGGQAFAVTPNCTYAGLGLVSAPFLWRFGRPAGPSAMRLAAATGLLLALDLVRVASALHLHLAGAPWRLVHDFPDVALHAGWIGAAVLLAARSDAATAEEPSSPDPSCSRPQRSAARTTASRWMTGRDERRPSPQGEP